MLVPTCASTRAFKFIMSPTVSVFLREHRLAAEIQTRLSLARPARTKVGRDGLRVALTLYDPLRLTLDLGLLSGCIECGLCFRREITGLALVMGVHCLTGNAFIDAGNGLKRTLSCSPRMRLPFSQGSIDGRTKQPLDHRIADAQGFRFHHQRVAVGGRRDERDFDQTLPRVVTAAVRTRRTLGEKPTEHDLRMPANTSRRTSSMRGDVPAGASLNEPSRYVGSSTRCTIINISADGAAIEVHDASYIPIRFQLMTEKDRVVRNCVAVWIERNTLGIQFESAYQSTALHSPSREQHPVQQQKCRRIRNASSCSICAPGRWVHAIDLPDRPKVVARPIRNGWIQRDGGGRNASYRITISALAAKRRLCKSLANDVCVQGRYHCFYWTSDPGGPPRRHLNPPGNAGPLSPSVEAVLDASEFRFRSSSFDKVFRIARHGA